MAGVSAVNFPVRMRALFIEQGISPQEFRNIHRYPLVLRCFPLITPRAMKLLDGAPDILASLDLSLRIHLEAVPKRTPLPPFEIADRLEKLGMYVTTFDDGSVHLFCGLMEHTPADMAVFVRLEQDFQNNPTVDDVAMLLRAYGVKLNTNNHILGPVAARSLNKGIGGDVCGLMLKKGITELVIDDFDVNAQNGGVVGVTGGPVRVSLGLLNSVHSGLQTLLHYALVD